jgi:glucose uptake protein GlcU
MFKFQLFIVVNSLQYLFIVNLSYRVSISNLSTLLVVAVGCVVVAVAGVEQVSHDDVALHTWFLPVRRQAWCWRWAVVENKKKINYNK